MKIGLPLSTISAVNEILKVLSIYVVFIPSYSLAQVVMQDIVPPSPKASAFHIYGTYPVNLSRGLADISIPLYTIEVDGKKFPITLRYHHSGIKFYETEQSNVATGWQIEYGGLISITKLGKKDMDHAFSDHSVLYFTENLSGDFDTLQKIYYDLNLSNELDGQYDIYNYDFCGRSGRFIYNKEGEVIKFPYNSIDFRFGFTSNNLFHHIDAYDEEGIQYRFGYSIDEDIKYCETSSSGTSSLLLTDIETPNGKRIKYTYKDSDAGYRLLPTHFGKVVDYRLGTSPTIDPTLCGTFTQESMSSYSTKIIKEIIFPNGKIVFTSDLGGLRIFQMDIYNDHGIIKTIKFNTADFESMQKRYALNSLEFKDANNNTEAKYEFTYDAGRFPAVQRTNAIDYWGYYNGQLGNKTLVPDFLISFRYDNSLVPFDRLIYSAPDTCSRQVNETLMQAYSLKKITYPTGGFTEFTYEANRYGPNNKLGGGLRISKIVNDDGMGNKTTKTYKYGNGIMELNPDDPNNYLRVSRNWGQVANGCDIRDYSYRIRYYGCDMNSTLTLGGGNQVYYREVVEYNGTETENNGRTTYKYDYYSNGYSGYSRDNCFISYFSNWANFRGGNLLEKIIEKKKEDGSWETVNKITNEYTFITKEKVDGLIVDKILDLPMNYYLFHTCFPSATLHEGNYIDFTTFISFRDNYLDLLFEKSLFKYYSYSISTGYSNLTSTTDTLNTSVGRIANKVNYIYDIPNYLQPTRETNTKSTGEIIEKRNKYVLSPDYVNISPYTQMIQRNIINPVLEQKVYNIRGSTETNIKTINTNFKQFYSGIIKPEKFETFYFIHTNDKITINNDYNSAGNLITQWKQNDTKEVYLWGYGGQYIVAKIINTDYVTASSFVNQALLDDPLSTATQIRNELNKIRIGLTNTKALVTTFTYEPLIGMTSQTDPAGRTTYYEYDSFNRLKTIRDQDGKVIKTIDYQYQQTNTQ